MRLFSDQFLLLDLAKHGSITHSFFSHFAHQLGHLSLVFLDKVVFPLQFVKLESPIASLLEMSLIVVVVEHLIDQVVIILLGSH